MLFNLSKSRSAFFCFLVFITHLSIVNAESGTVEPALNIKKPDQQIKDCLHGAAYDPNNPENLKRIYVGKLVDETVFCYSRNPEKSNSLVIMNSNSLLVNFKNDKFKIDITPDKRQIILDLEDIEPSQNKRFTGSDNKLIISKCDINNTWDTYCPDKEATLIIKNINEINSKNPNKDAINSLVSKLVPSNFNDTNCESGKPYYLKNPSFFIWNNSFALKCSNGKIIENFSYESPNSNIEEINCKDKNVFIFPGGEPSNPGYYYDLRTCNMTKPEVSFSFANQDYKKIEYSDAGLTVKTDFSKNVEGFFKWQSARGSDNTYGEDLSTNCRMVKLKLGDSFICDNYKNFAEGNLWWTLEFYSKTEDFKFGRSNINSMDGIHLNYKLTQKQIKFVKENPKNPPIIFYLESLDSSGYSEFVALETKLDLEKFELNAIDKVNNPLIGEAQIFDAYSGIIRYTIGFASEITE